jgi:hypothetical protein
MWSIWRFLLEIWINTHKYVTNIDEWPSNTFTFMPSHVFRTPEIHHLWYQTSKLDTTEMKLETILRQLPTYPSSQYFREVENALIFTSTPYPHVTLHLINLNHSLELFTITFVIVDNCRSYTDSTLIICYNTINITGATLWAFTQLWA